MRKITVVFISLFLALAICACGKKEENPEPVPTVTPIATPVPTSTPTPEPVYEKGGAVTVEGVLLDSYIVDGVKCVKGEDLLSASKYYTDDGEKYVPIEEWCEENHIGTLYDEEFDHLYCNYSSGDWTYPEGYDVPVLMYHEVQPESAGGDGDTVTLENFELQMQFLHDNGFTTIWFEDLEHIDEITKPIILTFDDGYVGNYEYMLPVLEKYDMKATIFYFVKPIYHVSRYLTEDQVVELSKSGRIQIESHTMNHPYLNSIGQDEQKTEIEQSKLEITRLTGQIPYVLAYPYGDTTGYIVDRIHEGYYKFGVKMVGLRSYNTSDDCATVWRFWPNRDMDIYTYMYTLNSVFGEN